MPIIDRNSQDLSYIPAPHALYVHHSQVPQSVVKSNPAEWYRPSSEATDKLYSKKVPTFTPAAGWTDQEYRDNFKNYENRINELRASYNKSLMGAKDLKYSSVPAGYGPLDPLPNIPYYHSRKIIDAQGNYVDRWGWRAGNGAKNVDRVKYDDPSNDISDDSFGYNSDLEDAITGFKHSTVSDLRDWNYDPHKAAKHPDYATRQGDVASWDNVEGMPTLRRSEPIWDGRYFLRTKTIPDYSASLERFTHANGNNNTRLPNYSSKVTVADLEASGLLSKPQTIQYDSYSFGDNPDGTWGYAQRQSSEEGVRTARLQDLFTDRLLVPGKVDRSVQVSKLLSDAIGDARRSAILNTAARANYKHKPFGANILSAAGTHTLGRAHLAGVDNLSIPITFVDDVRGDGKQMRYAGDGLYTHLADLFPLLSVDPRYKMYRDKGIVRVFTDEDKASWSPGSSKIKLRKTDHSPRLAHLLDTMRTSSEADKFNTGIVVGADYHHNDIPANGVPQGDIRNALLHEGIHAATGFNSNLIDSIELHNKRKLYDKLINTRREEDPGAGILYDVDPELSRSIDELERDPASRTTALAAALGVSREDPNMTSRGYANTSEPEMLRALHHAKSGFARHLISENKLQPDAVVDEVQNPDKFLDFMQNVYSGFRKDYDEDPTSYSFPSSMSQVGTESEMARSVAGIQSLVQSLLDARRHEHDGLFNSPSKDDHIFKNENGDPSRIKWKDKIYTPAKQLDIFRNHIWPQVRNNNADKYQTFA